mmetsp:Transcript_7988/g.16094  ORF Transcript_7988/g.16094 Transcript_7988/m.16094 type:complete len:120 (-) Transcript_7988:21-380(-)
MRESGTVIARRFRWKSSRRSFTGVPIGRISRRGALWGASSLPGIRVGSRISVDFDDEGMFPAVVKVSLESVSAKTKKKSKMKSKKTIRSRDIIKIDLGPYKKNNIPLECATELGIPGDE